MKNNAATQVSSTSILPAVALMNVLKKGRD